jgi:hypothetical protein
MRATRTQYQEFPPEVFSNHYFGEDRFACEDVYWQKKQNIREHKKAVIERNQRDKEN